MRWVSGVNIAGEPFIVDHYHSDRQYWVDSEHNLIACIMNDYEDKIGKLEEVIERSKYAEIPTSVDDAVDESAVEFKRMLNKLVVSDKLWQGDGWKLEKYDIVQGKPCRIIMEIRKDWEYWIE